MNLQPLFLDSLGNIRSGWRILIFLLLVFAAASIVFFLASFIISDLTVYAPVLLVITLFAATAMMVKMFEKRPVHSVGIPMHRRMPLEIGQGAVIGGIMITAVFLIQFGAGWVGMEWRGLSPVDIAGIIVTSAVLFFLAGFGEELFFRGYPFQTLLESVSTPVAVVIMSVAFSVAHMTNPNISTLGMVNIFLAGVWLSVAYLKTRTLWFPTGLHVSWNFFQGSIYSYPVSGQMMDDRSLFAVSITGPPLLTGGEFGPEGSLITTVVLVLGTTYIYKSKFFIIGKGVWTVDRYIREELERYSG